MILRYDWPPKRGTSVGLDTGDPRKRKVPTLDPRINYLFEYQLCLDLDGPPVGLTVDH